jgi:hypothetical protein
VQSSRWHFTCLQAHYLHLFCNTSHFYRLANCNCDPAVYSRLLLDLIQCWGAWLPGSSVSGSAFPFVCKHAVSCNVKHLQSSGIVIWWFNTLSSCNKCGRYIASQPWQAALFCRMLWRLLLCWVVCVTSCLASCHARTVGFSWKVRSVQECMKLLCNSYKREASKKKKHSWWSLVCSVCIHLFLLGHICLRLQHSGLYV